MTPTTARRTLLSAVVPASLVLCLLTPDAFAGLTVFGNSAPGQRLWPHRRIKYYIHESIMSSTNPKARALEGLVVQAAQYVSVKTVIRLDRANKVPAPGDYIEVRHDPTLANLGKCQADDLGWPGKTAPRMLTIGTNCFDGTTTVGTIVHEFGHALGLHHEQKRFDQERYIRVDWAKLAREKPEMIHQWEMVCGAPSSMRQHKGCYGYGLAAGGYDFDSIMHYRVCLRAPASKNCDAHVVDAWAIIAKPASEPIGQRAGLSDGDIRAIDEMYRSTPEN